MPCKKLNIVLTLVVFKTYYSTLTFRKTRSRQNPTSLDICVSAISYKTSFGYRQKHNINLQLVWWFSKRHFNLVQVCDWLFWSQCHYICRSRKPAHNCYHLTLWDWRLLVVIWTWELLGCRVIVANRLIISENVCNALVFITYASFSTVTRVSDNVGYTVN